MSNVSVRDKTLSSLFNDDMIPMNRLSQTSCNPFIPTRPNLHDQLSVLMQEGKAYIAHCKNANDAKIRGEKIIQVVFVQVLEQHV